MCIQEIITEIFPNAKYEWHGEYYKITDHELYMEISKEKFFKEIKENEQKHRTTL